MRYIIVDGYNVIRADPRLQSIEARSLEEGRAVLVKTLASSPRLANDTITVVFDGTYSGRAHVHTQRFGRIDTVYSAQGQTADDVIVRQARALSGRGTVVVITNDTEVRERCRAEGCEVSGSDNLLNQLPGRRHGKMMENTEENVMQARSTDKRGNPRRASRRSRRNKEYRF